MRQLPDIDLLAGGGVPNGRRHEDPPDGPCLEDAVEAAVDRLRAERTRRARELGAPHALRERLDRALRTDRLELIDRPDFPASRKLTVSRYLHLYNTIFGNYRAFVDELRPFLPAVDRPLRVLEIASGSGLFTLALAREAARVGTPIEVTGSDLEPALVDSARRAAHGTGLPVRFEVLDATALSAVSERYDVVFTANAMHHFAPGLLARVIRAAGEVAPAFVGIDGRRGLTMLAVVGGGGLASGRWWIAHDALVSARRFYAASELRCVAQLAAPGAQIDVRSRGRHQTVLTVAYERSA